MDATSKALLEAQIKAEALFQEVVDAGLVSAGKLESDLTDEIHGLAQSRFGLRRHWHKRLARSGPNTLLTYHEESADRRITADDIVYLDFGPVFEEWEADFGRTYVVGDDPIKHRLVGDLAEAFQRGKEFYRRSPDLTAGQLYDYAAGLAADYGASRRTRPSGGGLRKQSRQLQMMLAHAAVVPAFLHVLTCNDRCSTCIHGVISVIGSWRSRVSTSSARCA